METANVTGRVSRGSDRRVADQEYRCRRRSARSDAAVLSAENANMKLRRQESRQRSAAEYYEAASHDRSL